MTKKELIAMMQEIKDDQAKAKEEQITKADINSIMKDFLSGDKKEEVKVDEVKVDEVKVEDKNLTKEEVMDFMKGFKGESEDKDLSSMNFKAANGETIPMFKSKNDKKGFGF